MRHFIDAGYDSSGLDINQADAGPGHAALPERASRWDMCIQHGSAGRLITCFLYSIHYSAGLERLAACIANVRRAGRPGCSASTPWTTRIDNRSYVSHTAHHADGLFGFSSGWYYSGEGERQLLRLRIERRWPEPVRSGRTSIRWWR